MWGGTGAHKAAFLGARGNDGAGLTLHSLDLELSEGMEGQPELPSWAEPRQRHELTCFVTWLKPPYTLRCVCVVCVWWVDEC